jgi:hypothetical protein
MLAIRYATQNEIFRCSVATYVLRKYSMIGMFSQLLSYDDIHTAIT